MEFTWFNNRENESWARLDRFLCDLFVLSWYPKMIQRGLNRILSDHNPVFFGELKEYWGPKPFIFLNEWLDDKRKYYKKEEVPVPRWDSFQVKKILAQASVDLEAEFSMEEVWKALCDCDGNKAPGPDRLNLNFVKKNWDWIKKDFMLFMKAFHTHCSVIKELNCTFIALILKIMNLISINNYRPLSLVGSIYKVLAKVLANRLKSDMDSVIGPTQMAFVKDR
ncbi:hypothetical protein Ddye_029263 [Dipteronia dyeriana]|uniref:Reverse transcriptase domain-containing protein n=1 Tax=Dipteronia dyeriana TaxID=168575 RepID=A0AAD9WKH1_9ROSI|nr:hypothetical protein Ddye_029263 [Dipteronia dyeriana]